MSSARLLAAGLAGVTGFAAGFYLALAIVVAVMGIDDPFETQLELTALAFGTLFSVPAVAAASGRFKAVIGRVAVTGAASAAGAGVALTLIESDVAAMGIAGLAIVAAEVTAAWLVA